MYGSEDIWKNMANLQDMSDDDIKKAVDKACLIALGLELALALCMYGVVSRLFGECWGEFTLFMLYAISVKRHVAATNCEVCKEALSARDEMLKEKETENGLEENEPEKREAAEKAE